MYHWLPFAYMTGAPNVFRQLVLIVGLSYMLHMLNLFKLYLKCAVALHSLFVMNVVTMFFFSIFSGFQNVVCRASPAFATMATVRGKQIGLTCPKNCNCWSFGLIEWTHSNLKMWPFHLIAVVRLRSADNWDYYKMGEEASLRRLIRYNTRTFQFYIDPNAPLI